MKALLFAVGAAIVFLSAPASAEAPEADTLMCRQEVFVAEYAPEAHMKDAATAQNVVENGVEDEGAESAIDILTDDLIDKGLCAELPAVDIVFVKGAAWMWCVEEDSNCYVIGEVHAQLPPEAGGASTQGFAIKRIPDGEDDPALMPDANAMMDGDTPLAEAAVDAFFNTQVPAPANDAF